MKHEMTPRKRRPETRSFDNSVPASKSVVSPWLSGKVVSSFLMHQRLLLLGLLIATLARVSHFAVAVTNRAFDFLPLAVQPSGEGDNCVYVPGVGFSGFWYVLGRLQGLKQLQDEQQLQKTSSYYCYSAGCMAVVATLSHQSLDRVYDMAMSIQHQWQQGKIHRWDVVPQFVHSLVPDHANHRRVNLPPRRPNSTSYAVWNLYYPEQQSTENYAIAREKSRKPRQNATKAKDWLSQIKVITTRRKISSLSPSSSSHGGNNEPMMVVRSPRSIQELKKMLIQTAWIPFVTGSSWWNHEDAPEFHMDGAFSSAEHPECSNPLRLPIQWNLIMNSLNVQLNGEDARQFWNLGWRAAQPLL